MESSVEFWNIRGRPCELRDFDFRGVDIRGLDEYQWRELLREVTPFVDHEWIDDLDLESDCLTAEDTPRDVVCKTERTEEAITEHTVSIVCKTSAKPHGKMKHWEYVVSAKHIKTTGARAGDTYSERSISYTPFASMVLIRLGLEKSPSNHEVYMNLCGNIRCTCCSHSLIEGDGSIVSVKKEGDIDGVVERIIKEVYAAWKARESDRQREELLAVSTEAKPDPKGSGRDGRL